MREGSKIGSSDTPLREDALIRSIEDLTRDEIEYEVSPGWVDIQYGNLSERARTLVDSFFVGICLMADEFPEHVRIV